MVHEDFQSPEEVLNIGQGIAEFGLAEHTRRVSHRNCVLHGSQWKSGLVLMDETQC